MNFLDFITDTDADPRPRRIMLYGTHGIGKSTWAACAPDPIFIRTEDGLRDIKGAKTFPLCKSVADIWGQCEALLKGDHSFKTLVIDSADWMERLIQEQVCRDAGKESIAEVGGGFAKGQIKAAAIFSAFLKMLEDINVTRNMTIILIAHCEVERFENPETGAYHKYAPKLDKRTSTEVQEWANEVLFANYKVFVKKDNEHFGRENLLAVGGSERVIYTCEKATHYAKNRLALPPELPMAFAAYWDAVKAASSRVVIGGEVVTE